jgi:hypothetical protein
MCRALFLRSSARVSLTESLIQVPQTQLAFHPLAQRRSHDAVIRVYDTAGNVVETHEHRGDFKE